MSEPKRLDDARALEAAASAVRHAAETVSVAARLVKQLAQTPAKRKPKSRAIRGFGGGRP